MYSHLEKWRKELVLARLLLIAAIVVAVITTSLILKVTSDAYLDKTMLLVLIGIQVALVAFPSAVVVALATNEAPRDLPKWTDWCMRSSQVVTPLLFCATLGVFVVTVLLGLSWILNPTETIRLFLAAFTLIGVTNWTIFNLFLWGVSSHFDRGSSAINITSLLWLSSLFVIITGSALAQFGGISTADTGAGLVLGGHLLAATGTIGTVFSISHIAKISEDLYHTP